MRSAGPSVRSPRPEQLTRQAAPGAGPQRQGGAQGPQPRPGSPASAPSHRPRPRTRTSARRAGAAGGIVRAACAWPRRPQARLRAEAAAQAGPADGMAGAERDGAAERPAAERRPLGIRGQAAPGAWPPARALALQCGPGCGSSSSSPRGARRAGRRLAGRVQAPPPSPQRDRASDEGRASEGFTLSSAGSAAGRGVRKFRPTRLRVAYDVGRNRRRGVLKLRPSHCRVGRGARWTRYFLAPPHCRLKCVGGKRWAGRHLAPPFCGSVGRAAGSSSSSCNSHRPHPDPSPRLSPWASPISVRNLPMLPLTPRFPTSGFPAKRETEEERWKRERTGNGRLMVRAY